VFWGNYYSARSVRPVSDTAVITQPESGPAGWMWLVGVGLVAAAIVLAAARRRRLDTYYA
jgi:hypothetical protein